MKILAPVDCTEDILFLYEAGAEEFFCGYTSEQWYEDFNEPSHFGEMIPYPINRRHARMTNVKSKMELKKMCGLAEELNINLYLTVNGTFYLTQAYELLDEFFADMYEIGVRHLIVSDLGLVYYLSKKWPQMKLSISCLNQVENEEAVHFYKQFQTERIVLPRHIPVAHARQIIRANPDIKFECFALGEKCLFNDGLCRCNHSFGAICNDVWNCTYYRTDGKNPNRKEMLDLAVNEGIYIAWSNEKTGFVSSASGYNLGCSLCSIASLSDLDNMESWKLSGRGKNKKMLSERVRLTRHVIDMVTAGGSEMEIRKYVPKILGEQYCVDYAYCFMRGI